MRPWKSVLGSCALRRNSGVWSGGGEVSTGSTTGRCTPVQFFGTVGWASGDGELQGSDQWGHYTDVGTGR